ncbi:uncharacterized protein LOC131636446 [Vicia villosa]|uniref:uncharacterized protein LOC131636446 n=1 Tax=Vicia villosa TaxID=3911 RepID=UPI00273CBF2C|nr:uncharacterized protein LOC131636446 [Vicia villosa]
MKEHEKKPIISEVIPEYDIAIVGGGMVGMSLACFLASMPMTKQLSVAIIDSNPALASGLIIQREDPPDPRVSTVTPASISFLQGIQFLRFVFFTIVVGLISNSLFFCNFSKWLTQFTHMVNKLLDLVNSMYIKCCNSLIIY